MSIATIFNYKSDRGLRSLVYVSEE